MKINSDIFKAYDIRGIYPEEINEDTAYLIGRAFVKFLRKKNPRIVIGQDNRLSSPALFKSLTKGIIDQGANVVDIGLSTTPMLYFSVAHFKYDGGIEISSSHNPAQYNGFKLVKEKAIPISGESGIKEIKDMALKGEFRAAERGKIIKREVLEDYISFNLKGINLSNGLKPLKIVIDTANGVAGILVSRLFKKVNHKIFHLYSELDGRFPNHPPDPLKKENLKTLCDAVKRKKADLGAAFDGDGDRIIFTNELGRIISGDLITALITRLILKEKPGEKILYDVRSSNIVKETIEENKGIPVIGRIGHSFIKEKMRNENIVFAGEFSGHYYHKNHYFFEYPIFILLKILEVISQNQKPLSQIIKPFRKYFHSGEINFKVKEKEKILKKIEEKFKSGKILKIDGLRIDFKNWWFLIRPSNTEPVIRLVVEAKTKKLMKGKVGEIKRIIQDC